MNWFFVALFIMSGEPKIKNVFKNAGYAAVANRIVAVSSATDGLHIFDADLKLVTKFIVGEYSFVYPFGESILVISADANQASFLLRDGTNEESIGFFKPRTVAVDRESMVFFPIIDTKGSVLVQEYMNWGIDDALCQKFTFNKGIVERLGEPFLKPPQGLRRLGRNYKGLWIFQNRNGAVEVILQTDPFVFGQGESERKRLQLPDYHYRTDAIPKTDRIFTYKEWIKYRHDFYFNTSLIWGAYRYNGGYVVCYSIDKAWGGQYRLAFFDQSWAPYGENPAIDGRLIGIVENQGIIITDADDENYSRLKKIELKHWP